eukprot:TRINITY_DN24794_c0_g1_i1.p1 TRINITY_DN24794_c0_g1~~TRINITY_DN24794_c0_g1_i1.p1  ORF type:complete len:321 (+),score=54.77 TRINITY_DN24794_c0_g1_i1:49-1011(+)
MVPPPANLGKLSLPFNIPHDTEKNSIVEVERVDSHSFPIQLRGKEITIDEKDLVVIQRLGQGSQGYVELVKHRGTGILFAKKVVRTGLNNVAFEAVQTEHASLVNCSCLYIVALYSAFAEDQCYTFMLEYMDGGTLADIIKNKGALPEKVIARILKDALRGLKEIHKAKIIHRDIKPSNILLSASSGIVKIADFGVSREIEPQYSAAQSFVGTATYMAPERLKGDNYTRSSDIWALGLVVLECSLGAYPFPTCQVLELMQSVCDSPLPNPPPSASTDFKDFLGCMLNRDPSGRKKASELLRHPFTSKACTQEELKIFMSS